MIYKLYTFDNQFIKETNGWPRDFTGIVKNAFKSKHWCDTGKLHRIDGPAFESNYGTKGWWINGKSHRLDGPAVEWDDGRKEWRIDGVECTKEQHALLVDIMKLKGLK